MSLNKETVKNILAIMKPYMDTREAREQKVQEVFRKYDREYLDINYEGSTGEANKRIVYTLMNFGTFTDGEPALCVLLDELKEDYGVDKREEIETLKQKVYQDLGVKYDTFSEKIKNEPYSPVWDPWKNLTLPQAIVVIVIIISIVFMMYLYVHTNNGSPTETSAPMLMETSSTPNPTDASIPPTYTSNSTPSLIPTNTAISNFTETPQLSPSELAYLGVTRNDEWTIHFQEFDRVPMLLVPIGCFEMGSTNEQIESASFLGDLPEWVTEEQPSHEICFNKPFWIDSYEVSNEQFAQFGGIAAENSSLTAANFPRDTITWYEARDFCELRDARLPTESEWEYVARGVDGLIFPWGNEFDATRLNYSDDNSSGDIDGYSNTAPVDAFDTGISWVGTYQMSGNVWEWVSTIYDNDDLTGNFLYPYNKDDGREDMGRIDVRRVLRGGSWNFAANYARTTNRYNFTPAYGLSDIGFRCVRDFE